MSSKYLALLYIGLNIQVVCLASRVIEDFSCFNTVFEISCQENEVIVFDTAQYGRNDTVIASRCLVPYQRNCDVDVHFPLNRVCAGKPKCSLAVNTALFGDPCGYEEFLKVSYRCVAVSTVQQTCFGENGPTFYDHGFIASPNYPDKYFMDADCHWKLSVQKRQRLTVTLLDFELDVKRGGQCYDFLEISAGDKVYFNDCGSLGKQVIQVDSSKALVRFKTGHGSLTQRGFLVFFEAHGPGCPDLEDIEHGTADYFIEEDILYANVSCRDGFHFSGSDASRQLIQCSGSYWNTVLSPCVPSTPPTTPPSEVTSEAGGNTSLMDDSNSVIGVVLGVVSAMLLITLLLVLALYFHRRRRNAERKLDQWRFVINNLQESSANEENLKRATLEGSMVNTPTSNIRKAAKKGGKKAKKLNNKEEEEWQQGRNLLSTNNYDEEEMIDIMALDPRNTETMLKYPMPALPDEPVRSQYQLSRKNSRSGRYSLARSRDSQLEDSAIWVDRDFEKPRCRRDFRHKRAKSGQWDPIPANRSFVTPSSVMNCSGPVSTGLLKRQFTQSAPDILEIEGTPNQCNNNEGIYCCHTEAYCPVDTSQAMIGRSSTIANVPANRSFRGQSMYPQTPQSMYPQNPQSTYPQTPPRPKIYC